MAMLLKNIVKLSLILIFLAFLSMNYSCATQKHHTEQSHVPAKIEDRYVSVIHKARLLSVTQIAYFRK